MAVYISFDSGTLLGIRVRQSLDPGYSNEIWLSFIGLRVAWHILNPDQVLSILGLTRQTALKQRSNGYVKSPYYSILSPASE